MKILISAIISSACILGCSRKDGFVFRAPLNEQREVDGNFDVKKSALYSIALESTVNQNLRENAFQYLRNSDRRKPIVADVSIEEVGGASKFHLERRGITNPGPSSWTSTKIYSELLRVKLISGKYRIRVSFFGDDFTKQGFTSAVIVEKSYTGK